MLRASALPCLGLTLTGCAFSVPEGAYTVSEVRQDIAAPTSALDGRVIAVVGWLGDCGGNDCAIYPTAQDAQLVAAGDSASREWSDAIERRLAIGAQGDFDMRASVMQHSKVIVRGTVNAQWRRPASADGNKFGCLDRCDDIRPQSIQLLVN
jgi:hypothetical protein